MNKAKITAYIYQRVAIFITSTSRLPCHVQLERFSFNEENNFVCFDDLVSEFKKFCPENKMINDVLNYGVQAYIGKYRNEYIYTQQ